METSGGLGYVQNKLRVREYLARAVEAILDLDRLLHKVNDAIPGVASKLLLVAHEALETERAIQGAVQEEEVGGVVAQVAVEVVGLIPGLERSDRLVRAFEVGEAVENGGRARPGGTRVVLWSFYRARPAALKGASGRDR